MSAICGVVLTDGGELDAALLARQIHSLDHRGIDARGAWRDGQVGLGHQMLHVTPESLSERLPWRDPESGLAIATDARLDNRDDLFRKLSIEGSKNRGLSDSVLILKAYERWGEDCVQHLLGDFAFAIWDGRKRELFCATDPMGLRPLFYHWRPGLFVFASEIRAIHAIPAISRKPDLRSLADLGLPGQPAYDDGATFFEGVRSMNASSSLTVTSKGVVQREYWRPDSSRRLGITTEDDCVEAFRELFSDAVRVRLRSAFPVASMFSGGLDSSAITGTAADLLAPRGQRLVALSAVLPPGEAHAVRDERAYIDQLSRPNLHIDYVCDPWRGPFDAMDQLVASAEMPACPSTHYLNTAMAEAAGRHGARVLLNGMGGEAGATFHGAGIMAEWLKDGEFGLLARELLARSALEKRSIASLVKGELIMPLLPPWLTTRWKPRFDLAQSRRSSVIRSDFVRGQFASGRRRNAGPVSDGRIVADHRENQVNMIGHYRTNGRRLLNFGAFVGHEKIEMRAPFLDRRIIEFCLALPAPMKIHRGHRRYITRAAMQDILPETLRWRRDKTPYSPDFHTRYNRQLKEARDIVTHCARTPLIDEIIDIDRLLSLLDYRMISNRGNTPEEFAAMHTVPRALYLLSFLKTFS